MKDQATPRPWLLKGKLTVTKCGSMTKLDHVICTVKNQLSGFNLSEERLEQEANALLIVKAVNSYDEAQETMRVLQSTASDRAIEIIKLNNQKAELVEALKTLVYNCECIIQTEGIQILGLESVKQALSREQVK